MLVTEIMVIDVLELNYVHSVVVMVLLVGEVCLTWGCLHEQ